MTTTSRNEKAEVLDRVRRMVDDLDDNPSHQRSSTSPDEDTRFSHNQTEVYDDGTNTFFWQAHSVTVLLGMLAALLYIALFENVRSDTEFNTKRGVVACIMMFCLFGMTQAKDGPFKRPHPAIWRFVLCLSIIYELFLIFMLFQSVSDARQLIAYIDPELGKELPEKSYADDCDFYTPNHPGGSFHNFWEKWDIFVFAHILGWYVKMLMMRDYWLCNIISILFEIMEYTLEHQLNNFGECWWDHWIMDFVVCNGLGIWLGMKTLNYLNMKPYSWRGLYHIPSYKGKLQRMVLQFTPYSWTKFEWRPTDNLKRWLAVLGICTMWTIAELNTFYLKTLLWIPPPNPINWARMIMLIPVGSVAMRETYQYIEDQSCKKFGQQSWVLCAIIVTEVLISVKFQYEVITRPLPEPYHTGWIVFLIGLALYTVWRFCIWSPNRRWRIHAVEDESLHHDSDSSAKNKEHVTRTVETTRVLNSSITKRKSHETYGANGAGRTKVGADGDGGRGSNGSASSAVGGTPKSGARYQTRSRYRETNGK